MFLNCLGTKEHIGRWDLCGTFNLMSSTRLLLIIGMIKGSEQFAYDKTLHVAFTLILSTLFAGHHNFQNPEIARNIYTT
jgi:hypothetical protein